MSIIPPEPPASVRSRRPTRHDERSGATRAALVAAARPLFAARGFEAVPAEEIVAVAGLTRGALYHHFGGKPGLFDAVHAELHAEVAGRIARAAEAAEDAWAALVAGCLAFLDACAEPEFQRVALLDAPAVLGWERWRAVDAAHGLGLLKQGLDETMQAGALAERPVDPLAHLLSGAMNEAGMWIARADAPARARREAGAALVALLEGLRAEQK